MYLWLLFCRAVWAQVCRGKATGGGVQSVVVVATAAALITRAIRMDWLRLTASLPAVGVLPSWCVIDKTFQLTQERFTSGGVPTASSPTLPCPLRVVWCCRFMCHATLHSLCSHVVRSSGNQPVCNSCC